MGKRKMMKRRRAEDEEEEGDSGDLLPTSFGINGFKKNPLGFLSVVPLDTQPVQPRYQTRRAKALLAQCAASFTTTMRRPIRNVKGTPCESSNLRPAVKILKEARDQSTVETSNIPTTQSQGSKSQAVFSYQYSRTANETSTPILATKNETLGNLRNSVSAESKDTSNPTSKDNVELDKLCSELIAQAQGLQDLHQDAHLLEDHEVVVDNHLRVNEGIIESHIVSTRQEENVKKNEKQLCRTSSLNFTEIAEMLTDSPDLDEVDSASDCALVTVGKYRVKEEVAPLLRSIISKYGDIAEGCILKTISTRSSLLKILCEIYQKLEQMGSKNITPVELRTMLDVVRDIESAGVKVGWFRQRLDDISKTLQLFQGYANLKDAKERSFQGTEIKKQELLVLQDEVDAKKQKLQLLQDELAAMEAEAEEINGKVFDTRAKMTSFYQSPFLDGLL